MAGTGVVADETIRTRERVEQRVEVAQRIVEERDVPAGGAQARGEIFESIARPLAQRAAGAGVNDDSARGAGRREAGGRRREGPVERGRECAPVFGAMRVGGRG